MSFKNLFIKFFSLIAWVFIIVYVSGPICVVSAMLFDDAKICAPFVYTLYTLQKVSQIREDIFFQQLQRKIQNQTADGVDNFLYAKMIWTRTDWLQSAHKINPSIPKDKLVDFYLEQSANMGYRESIGSYAKKLASDGTQEFKHEHDKANQMYKQSLSQVKTLIINGCKINSDIDIWSDFYTYKDRMGKVDTRLLDKLFFVRQMVTDEYSYEPHNDENIKQATFIYMYDLINCNHIMQNSGGVNDYIPDNYERFVMHRNEKSRVLLYALEIVTKKDLNLPKPTNESDIQKEQALKEKAMLFAQEYQNEFLKGK